MNPLLGRLPGPACGLAAAFVLAACATGPVIEAPGVSLRNVEVTSLNFSRQTFLLDFDVTNPNPFPLPVTRVRYGVELDGQHFAGGESSGRFTVPALGDGTFAISVELNLLKTAPRILEIVRDGDGRDIPYALEGNFGVDIPFVEALPFRMTGEIRLRAHDR
jgi:LEA14-like dessication related protein